VTKRGVIPADASKRRSGRAADRSQQEKICMSRAIVLGSPPEFGKDGSSPPVSSEPVVVSTKTFVVGDDGPDLSHIASRVAGIGPAVAFGSSAAAGASITSGAVVGTALLGPLGLVLGAGLLAAAAGRRRQQHRREPERAVRQLTYSQLWRRDDPIVQLPPGTAQERTYTVTTGIEQSRTRELSRSLGFKTGDAVVLSGSVGTKFGLQLTLSAQETHTVTLRLQNPGTEKYRRFARWSVVHRLEVVSFSVQAISDGQAVAKVVSGGGSRHLLVSVEIPDSNSANLTAVNVDPSI
jgi:hypothetical protein